MSCFSELTYAIYADGELPAEDTRQVEGHLAACPRCRALVAALREENRVLSSVLTEVESEAPLPAASPAWRRAAVWTGAAVVAVALARHAASGWWAPSPTGPDWLSLLFEVAVFLTLNAGTLATVVATLAVATMVALTIAGVVFMTRRPARLLVGLAGLAVATLLSEPASALETRGGATVTIVLGETVEGTLVAWGDAVRIEGTVDGDLIAVARTVEVRGTVKGDLILAGAIADIRGTVDGNTYSFAGTLGLRGQVTRSLYGLNRATDLEPESRVGADASLVGRDLRAEGAVGRTLWSYGATTHVAGTVARDVIFRGHELTLAAPARIGGSLIAHVAEAGDVRTEPGAAIGGKREIRLAPRGSTVYAEPKFYFWVATNLFGALLLGALALVLTPRFFHASAQAVGVWGRSLGLGAAVLVAGPITMLLAAITLVGLPLALVALALYLLGLYVAQILVGAFLGRTILRATSTGAQDSLLALVVGLAILTAAVQIPLVGTMIRLAVSCLGLGAFSYQLYRAARPRRT